MTYLTFFTCFILGELIKLLFKSLDKRWLPFIVGAFGIVFHPLVNGCFTLEMFAEGLISGFASSGGYEALKTATTQIKTLKK